MEIESGLWFGTGFDVRIYQKPVKLSTIVLKSCPLSKLVLGQFVLDH